MLQRRTVLNLRNGLVKVNVAYDDEVVVGMQEGVLPIYEYSEIELENPEAFRVDLYIEDEDGRIIDIQRVDGTSWAHPIGKRFKSTCTFRVVVREPEA